MTRGGQFVPAPPVAGPSCKVDLSKPRSARVHQAVLEATRALLGEGGLPAATVDAISDHSGVSKATIYKHWPSRTAVAAEAFGLHMADAITSPTTGDSIEDLTEHIRRVSAFYASPAGTVFAQLIAACVTDPHGAEYFRDFFLADRRKVFATLWQKGVAEGHLSPEVDAEVATDLLFGPLIFRLLSGHAPLTPKNADAITKAALKGLKTQTP
jgi:AcrR family transcriptional regulator